MPGMFRSVIRHAVSAILPEATNSSADSNVRTSYPIAAIRCWRPSRAQTSSSTTDIVGVLANSRPVSDSSGARVTRAEGNLQDWRLTP